MISISIDAASPSHNLHKLLLHYVLFTLRIACWFWFDMSHPVCFFASIVYYAWHDTTQPNAQYGISLRKSARDIKTLYCFLDTTLFELARSDHLFFAHFSSAFDEHGRGRIRDIAKFKMACMPNQYMLFAIVLSTVYFYTHVKIVALSLGLWHNALYSFSNLSTHSADSFPFILHLSLTSISSSTLISSKGICISNTW